MARISEAVVNSRQKGTYLKVHRSSFPPLNLWLIAAAVVFSCLVFIVNQWSAYYWYVAAGTGLAYLVAEQVHKFWRWWKLGRDAVFFDPLYFVSIAGGQLQAFPLSHFNDTDIILAMDGKHYLARFHFQEASIIVPCVSSNDQKTLHFQNLLQQYSGIVKQSAVHQAPIQQFPQTWAEKIACRRVSMISAAFGLVLLWFIIPISIDRNQYLSASGKNTATAYRTYLAEPRNLRYRETARTDIRRLYDLSIKKYRGSSTGSEGANAFAQLVEYLRDKNLYTVRMLFYPQSKLIDLPPSSQYHIISVTPSFSKEKNEARQDQVISTVKTSLGQMFPTDILAIGGEELVDLPSLEVYYTYRNKSESIYYPEKEQYLPKTSRTWYYGIEIDWWFKISLPTQSEPLYVFNLVSQPAQQFQSESFTADAVYANMASSAFNDFQTEFYRQFFGR